MGRLELGGDFTLAGGASANRIAKWDGSSWSKLANGVNGTVHALAVFDHGTSPMLYAGGEFFEAGVLQDADFVARWNGSGWFSFGASGLNGAVHALTVRDDGSDAALYLGGSFTVAGGLSAKRIASWTAPGGRHWAAG